LTPTVTKKETLHISLLVTVEEEEDHSNSGKNNNTIDMQDCNNSNDEENR
jgi:hypothetical protein